MSLLSFVGMRSRNKEEPRRWRRRYVRVDVYLNASTDYEAEDRVMKILETAERGRVISDYEFVDSGQAVDQ